MVFRAQPATLVAAPYAACLPCSLMSPPRCRHVADAPLMLNAPMAAANFDAAVAAYAR
jgi:hypothetical protein